MTKKKTITVVVGTREWALVKMSQGNKIRRPDWKEGRYIDMDTDGQILQRSLRFAVLEDATDFEVLD